MQRIAVEPTLSQVKQYLQAQGLDVSDLNQQATNADVIVISGQDKNVLGMEDATTKASVINAEGLTAEEVYQVLNNLQQY